MRRLIALGVILLAAGFAWAAAAAETRAGDPVRGARFYSDNCGRCHNARPPNEHTNRDWSIVMTHMRIVAGLPGQQARDVHAFLTASNNPPRQVAATSGPVTGSGAGVIDQYMCRGCHVIGGDGGSLGPDLAGLFQRRNDEWIRVQIQTPRAHNPASVMPELGLNPAQVDAIMDTLRDSL